MKKKEFIPFVEERDHLGKLLDSDVFNSIKYQKFTHRGFYQQSIPQDHIVNMNQLFLNSEKFKPGFFSPKIEMPK